MLQELRKLGGDSHALVSDYFGDPGDREVTKQRIRRLREMLCEHRIGRPEPNLSEAPQAEEMAPQDDRSAASKATNDEATHPAPDPGEVFRARLRDILEDVVRRLEDLAEKVLPGGENKEPFSD